MSAERFRSVWSHPCTNTPPSQVLVWGRVRNVTDGAGRAVRVFDPDEPDDGD